MRERPEHLHLEQTDILLGHNVFRHFHSSGHFQMMRRPDVIYHAADRQVSAAEAF
jgi:hypothetical protein